MQRYFAALKKSVACQTIFAATMLATLAHAQSPVAPPDGSPGGAVTAQAQPGVSASDAAIHDELRTLRDQLVDAWQKHDLDALLTHVAPNVVVTWQNGEVSRGHAGIRKFYAEVMGGTDPLITAMQSNVSVDDLSILYGGTTAVAFGSIEDVMTLGRAIARAPFLHVGNSIALNSRWTATLVKLDGRWLVASYHVSTDAFSNPILGKAIEIGKQVAVLAALGGLVLGAVLAALFIRLRRKSI
jgi:ketosteroid isomerase-like protein